MNKTLLIAYNGGTYGTYLEWVLNTLLTRNKIQSPFNHNGNSHRSKLGIVLSDVSDVIRLADSGIEYLTGRFHPKTSKDENLRSNLTSALDRFKKLVLIYPDPSQELMIINNYMTKIWDKEIYQGPMSYTDPSDIYDNYPVDAWTPLDDLPTWIKREHMSYNLFDAWRDQVEWYFPDVWHHDRCLTITTKMLLFDFKSTIEKILDFWGKFPERHPDELLPYHDEMLGLQRHLGQDQITKKIVDSVLIGKESVSWDPLPIASEAWIQRSLRDAGIELRCHGLDVFPCNTKQLSEICIF
jgi:hypothetical protein